jgi:hypothetical protein
MTPSLLPTLIALGLSAPAADEVSYVKDVKPFLAKYCAECHSGGKVKAGVSVESYAALVRGRGALVVPGQTDRSNLLKCMDPATARKIMPPRKYMKTPTAAEIAMVRAWIAAGARDDSAAANEEKAQPQKESPADPAKEGPAPSGFRHDEADD